MLRGASAFGLSTPRERGGFELPLARVVAVYEALGRIDGSVAWNIWNGNLGFSAALLSETAGDRIWTGGRDPIIANSARVTGAGRPVGGGYLLSGRWDMVSAIDVADWVALYGVVMVGEVPRTTSAGPDVRVFYVPVGDVCILDTWRTTGMRGTGSKTVTVDDVFVTDDLAVSPFAPARIDRPLFRVPAFTIASSGAAPIVIGIAQAGRDRRVDRTGTDERHRQRAAPRTAGTCTVTRRPGPNVTARCPAPAPGRCRGDRPRRRTRRTGDRAPTSPATRGHELRRDDQPAGVRDLPAACELVSRLHDKPHRATHPGRPGPAQHMLLSSVHMDIAGRLSLGLDAGTHVV